MRSDSDPDGLDVIVVGAGFAGMYALHRLRTAGFRVRVFEAGGDVGGTWYWNRYPGARVDVESMQYSYSFSSDLEQRWHWSERYAAQPELLDYIRHVADRFNLRPDIEFDTRVVAARFDERRRCWHVTTQRNESVSARFLVTAAGCLSAVNVPDIDGGDSFEGASYHTASWPADQVELAGKRVGVIGTGSTGVQVITAVAPLAARLHVFQRTPQFSVPARNTPMPPDYEAGWKREYAHHRSVQRQSRIGLSEPGVTPRSAFELPAEQRTAILEAAWRRGGAGVLREFSDTMTDEAANVIVADFVRGKIGAAVRDPAVRERLTPLDYPIGAKRICLDSGFYETFNLPHVRVVDLRSEPLVQITGRGIRTSRDDYDLDVLIFATGFDAVTGPLLRMDITGCGGYSLREAWAHGPRAYLGLAISGFPNMFTITGPGSPSVLSNMIVSIEQHVDWIADLLTFMRRHNVATAEARPAAEQAWGRHVADAAAQTLFPRANSWYLGANIPGKPATFMAYVGGVGPYRELCDGVARRGYEGFALCR